MPPTDAPAPAVLPELPPRQELNLVGPWEAAQPIESTVGDYQVGQLISAKTPRHALIYWIGAGLVRRKGT